MAADPKLIQTEALDEIERIEGQPGTGQRVRDLQGLADEMQADIDAGKKKVSSAKARRLLHASRIHGL